jgi:hypothetical protein
VFSVSILALNTVLYFTIFCGITVKSEDKSDRTRESKPIDCPWIPPSRYT